ncbi:hypothetical protein H5410_045356 [Solanum commersonii]|uniref:Myb/SANT-like DNA-binding domain-containing protein n=1 Tax=Solanum commersonii TaxID=4109 RepID=A0A9J5XAW4_SOLCO|nr:hypothetical protein H5410_045356 [Solanum commersonii]
MASMMPTKCKGSLINLARIGGLELGSTRVEAKWNSITSYCKRQGVNRGPIQCHKRWSNLAGDFKKIKSGSLGLKKK